MNDDINCITKYQESLKLNQILQKVGIKYSPNYFLAGGACRSVFNNEPIRDLDIFFLSESCLIELDNRINEIHKNRIQTPRAITYEINGEKVQLIKWYGTPVDIIEKFDFTICQCAYTLDDKFILTPKFNEHCKNKTLSLNNISEKVTSIPRLFRYIMKGYSIDVINFLYLILRLYEELGKYDSHWSKEYYSNLVTLHQKILETHKLSCANNLKFDLSSSLFKDPLFETILQSNFPISYEPEYTEHNLMKKEHTTNPEIAGGTQESIDTIIYDNHAKCINLLKEILRLQ